LVSDFGDKFSLLNSGNVLYTMHRKGLQDVVIALDADTGYFGQAPLTAVDARTGSVL
jgi:hypothetical protein